MELKYQRRILNLDLYGEKYEVKFPTSRQLDEYLKKVDKLIKGESKKSDFDLTQELLEKLGLPKKATVDMELEHLNDITKVLLDQKKI
jgi:hypothetical protein